MSEQRESGRPAGMDFYVLTLFPDMIRQALEVSILGRASRKGLIRVQTVNIRDFSEDRHMRVDDYPYGGGAGMVMEAEPVCRAIESVEQRSQKRRRVIYLTPQGRVLNQTIVEELAKEEELVLLCGHYEGIDERVLEEKVTDYISIGDYVLTGGELGALVLIDAVSRFVPGVLSNEESAQFESLQDNLLEYPHYTRPEVWRGRAVPEVLLSGDHRKIEAWRHEKSLERTGERRPDLLEKSFRTVGCWYGGERARSPAEELTRWVSRYGSLMDYDRRKLQKQCRVMEKQELLLLAVDLEVEWPKEGNPFRNLRGRETPLALLTLRGSRDSREKLGRFLTEQGFRLLLSRDLTEQQKAGGMDLLALEIRKKIL